MTDLGELDIRFARSAEGLHLAYTELGEGPPYVMRMIGAMTHLRLALEDPVMNRFEVGVAAFSRYVMMDERGAGMSDPVALADLPTLEQRVDDVLAVLDAAGIEQVTGLATGNGAAVALMLAVTHPERVESLVLYAPWARVAWAPDYPIGFDEALLQQFATAVGRGWGTGSFLDMMGPSAARTSFRERFARFELSSASPGQAEALVARGFDSDVRDLLPLVSVPTLVLHRTGDRVTPVAMGRYVAEHIPGARMVEVPGDDDLPFLGDSTR